MVRKLTLSAEGEVIARVKRLAAEQNTSVSALFARIVQSIGTPERGKKSVGRLTRKATGVIKMRSGKSDRELMEDSLLKKYGM